METSLDSRSFVDISSRQAPYYPIPEKHFTSVEHPGIIKNVNSAVDTLGGLKPLHEVRLWRFITAKFSLSKIYAARSRGS